MDVLAFCRMCSLRYLVQVGILMSQQVFNFGHPIVEVPSQAAPIEWSIYLKLDGTVPPELHRGQCRDCGRDMVSVMRYVTGRGYLIEYLCIGNRDSSCMYQEVL